MRAPITAVVMFEQESLLLLLLLALVVVVVLAALRGALGLLPMSRARRAALQRIRPVLEAGLAVLYLLIAVPVLFAGDDHLAPGALAALLLGLVVVSWFAIRDFVAGVFLKAGELCRVGDRIELEGMQGRVKALGYRVLTLETETGEEVFVPYAGLARRAIVRAPRCEGVHRHSFVVALDADADPLALMSAIKHLALASHWSSLLREPEVEAESGALRVHVFALGREHGVAIEAAVRRGLRPGS